MKSPHDKGKRKERKRKGARNLRESERLQHCVKAYVGSTAGVLGVLCSCCYTYYVYTYLNPLCTTTSSICPHNPAS